MKKIAIIFTVAMLMTFNAAGQQLAVDQAKKAITGLTLTVDSYNRAFAKLKPALTNEETAEHAETWALANRIKI